MKLLACLEKFIVALRTTRSDFSISLSLSLFELGHVKVRDKKKVRNGKSESTTFTHNKIKRIHPLVVSS